MEYLVHWGISVFAVTPREAAEQALEIHRDPGSEATVFNVMEERDHSKKFTVDLEEEE